MTFIPRTGNATLGSLIGMLVALLAGLGWWSHRERVRAGRDAADSPGEPLAPADTANHGWSHRPE